MEKLLNESGILQKKIRNSKNKYEIKVHCKRLREVAYKIENFVDESDDFTYPETILLNESLFRYMFNSYNKRNRKLKREILDKEIFIVREFNGPPHLLEVKLSSEQLEDMIQAENSSYGQRYRNMKTIKRHKKQYWESKICIESNKEIPDIDINLLFQYSEWLKNYTFKTPIIEEKQELVIIEEPCASQSLSSEDKSTATIPYEMCTWIQKPSKRKLEVFDNTIRYSLKQYSNGRAKNQEFTLLAHIVGNKLGLVPKFQYHQNSTNICVEIPTSPEAPEAPEAPVVLENIATTLDIQDLSPELRGFLWLFRMNPGPIILGKNLQTFHLHLTGYEDVLNNSFSKSDYQALLDLCRTQLQDDSEAAMYLCILINKAQDEVFQLDFEETSDLSYTQLFDDLRRRISDYTCYQTSITEPVILEVY